MAQVLEREVGGDAEEPASRVLITPDAGKALPGTNERLLAEVVRRLLLAGQTPEIAEDVALVTAEEGLELGVLGAEVRGSGGGIAAGAAAIACGEGAQPPPPPCRDCRPGVGAER